VIDPEDMRAVERLQDLYIAAESRGLSGLSMLDALREFADPKPKAEALREAADAAAAAPPGWETQRWLRDRAARTEQDTP
jgi:hypothetical protein